MIHLHGHNFSNDWLINVFSGDVEDVNAHYCGINVEEFLSYNRHVSVDVVLCLRWCITLWNGALWRELEQVRSTLI